MKKKRKIHKRLELHHLIIIFTCTLLFISVGYSYLYQNLSLTGKGNLVEKVEITDDIEFTYIKNTWYNENGDRYYKFEIKIVNKSSKDIDGWSIDIEMPDEIQNLSFWNVSATASGNVLTLKNLDYDSLLAPNVEVSLGVMFSTPTENLELDNIKIFKDTNKGGSGGDNPQIPAKELSSSITLANSWPGGDNKKVFQYNVTLTNNTTEPITSWSFDMGVSSSTKIEGMWNSNYIDTENGIITVSNKDWNGQIGAGASITIDFQLSSTEQTINPIISNAKGK